MVIRPTLLYYMECWAIKHQQVQNMWEWVKDVNRFTGIQEKDKIRNVIICNKVGDVSTEMHLKWFENVDENQQINLWGKRGGARHL